MSLETVPLWPHKKLVPAAIMPNHNPFSRSGGPSLGGINRSARTDRGWWDIVYRGVALPDAARRRLWNMLRVKIAGAAGLVIVPVWSHDSAEWPAGTVDGKTLTTHSDGTRHSDGSYYSQPSLLVQMATAAAIGDTSVTLRVVHNIEELGGIRFSYGHALYETGLPTAISGSEWTMPVFPAIRAAIPGEAYVEVDLPTCLCKLASDRAMDVSFSAGHFDQRDVAFVEAVEYWSDLAVA